MIHIDMDLHIENAFIQLVVKPAEGFWSAFSRQRDGAYIEDARTSAYYRQGRRRVRAPHAWNPQNTDTTRVFPSLHGPLRLLNFLGEPDPEGVVFSLTFALPDDQPLLLWQATMRNHGRSPLYLDRIEMLRVGYPLRSRLRLPAAGPVTGRLNEPLEYSGAIRPHPDPGELGFFSNGWQSWNHTGAFGFRDRFRRSRLGPLNAPMRANPGSPHPRRRGHFVSEMFAVLGDRRHRSAILAGFLSQLHHFGSVEAWTDPLRPSLHLWAGGDGARLDPGEMITTDWACLNFLQLDSPDPLGPYLEAVAREHKLESFGESPAGWSSWYTYYEKVRADDIRQNLKAARDLRPGMPLDVIQIDDGYATWVGDWFSFSDDFPAGVAPLAAEIRSAGFAPGLWLAPFIVHPRSRLRASHPGWILRNQLSLPVNAGYKWGAFTTALDLTHPDAMSYVQEVVHTAVHTWGFEFIKLDHLYAAALKGRYRDPTLTRAQVLRAGLETLRAAAGENAFLLGCGCPLGSAIGLVNAMRIGADVDGHWYPANRGSTFLVRKEPDYPSARNAVQNALTRAPLHRRWWINDPDCLLLDPDNPLTLVEIQTLATVIAMTGGSTMVSDPLPDLSPERLGILKAILPPVDRTPRVPDWFDRQTPRYLQLTLQGPVGTWFLAAIFNWDDNPREATLRLSDFPIDSHSTYLARRFWQGVIHKFSSGEQPLGDIPAHGVALLALRPATPGEPQYLGSDLHISQGLEVSDWKPRTGGLHFSLARPGRADGVIDLHLPHAPGQARLDGQPLEWRPAGPEVYRFAVKFDQTANIDLQWKNS